MFNWRDFQINESNKDEDVLPSDKSITKVYSLKPAEQYNPDEWHSAREVF